jgi:hypothetical protein
MYIRLVRYISRCIRLVRSVSNSKWPSSEGLPLFILRPNRFTLLALVLIILVILGMLLMFGTV